MKTEQLQDLLKAMTLDEKIDQMLQLMAAFYSDKAEEKTGPLADLDLKAEDVINAGTTLGVSGAKEAIRIQKEYLANNPHKIPLLFMADIIHGFRTIFPIPLALGSTWDEEAVEKVAEISAKEAAVSGIQVTFSPMVDLVRDPRWGRVMESTGEDPYLNSRLAQAFVKGYQGDNLKEDVFRLATCVKHFAAYGAAIAGRDYNTVNMSERQLRESYLPGYKAALDAGAKMVMTSFNTVDGVPATGNKWLFRNVLRDDFGFDGVVISDWGAVKELIAHGVAKDEKEAAELAVKAGVDIEMMTPCYPHHLKELVADGKVFESLIDEAVLRILTLKNDLGLFENPYRGANEELEKEVILSEEHRQSAREVAEKAIVLLKNEAILPFTKAETIAIVGPAANSHDILGAWQWQGKKSETISLSQGAKKLTENILIGSESFDYFVPSEKAVAEALSLAKKADKVVVALGETDWMSGEAASRSDIRLPQAQLNFFKKIITVNENVVVTIYNGRPLDLQDIQQAKGIVEAWMPGTEGGAALANILWGQVNPSARLSMSFPETVGQVPVYYNMDSTGRPYESAPDEKYVSKYLDGPYYAKYPFGYGLSYSHFTYTDLKVDHNVMTEEKPMAVTVTVQNDSLRDGEETVQLYLRDLVGEVVRPVKELQAFKKVWLKAGEKKDVTFVVKEAMLRYVHSDQRSRSDAGDFEAMVGPNSQTLEKISFTLKK